MLFETKRERTFDGPKSYIEGEWEYLDRSARVEAGRVRSLLNHWMADYPAEHRDELISRFKSGDHRAFSSATFELVLYALLRSTGWSIVVHPDLNSVRRCDCEGRTCSIVNSSASDTETCPAHQGSDGLPESRAATGIHPESSCGIR